MSNGFYRIAAIGESDTGWYINIDEYWTYANNGYELRARSGGADVSVELTADQLVELAGQLNDWAREYQHAATTEAAKAGLVLVDPDVQPF